MDPQPSRTLLELDLTGTLVVDPTGRISIRPARRHTPQAGGD
jgi:hypothetical protein